MSRCTAADCEKEVTGGVAFCHVHFAVIPKAIRVRLIRAYGEVRDARERYAALVLDALGAIATLPATRDDPLMPVPPEQFEQQRDSGGAPRVAHYHQTSGSTPESRYQSEGAGDGEAR